MDKRTADASRSDTEANLFRSIDDCFFVRFLFPPLPRSLAPSVRSIVGESRGRIASCHMMKGVSLFHFCSRNTSPSKGKSLFYRIFLGESIPALKCLTYPDSISFHIFPHIFSTQKNCIGRGAECRRPSSIMSSFAVPGWAPKVNSRQSLTIP